MRPNCFFSKYLSKKVNDESFYRKNIIEKIFYDVMEQTKTMLIGKPIYLIFDETTDSEGRHILNILIGECSIVSRMSERLISSLELEHTNSETINNRIIGEIYKFYEFDHSKVENIKLLLSDGAPYALKVGKLLRELIPHLKHVTCLCHAFHNICETIRNDSPNVNKVVSYFKKVLIKNKTNQNIFREITLTAVPKFPVITRWGTWLEFVCILFDKFDDFKKFTAALPDDSNMKDEIYSCMNSKHFDDEIKSAYKHRFLISTIFDLEKNSLSTENQIKIVKDSIDKIYELNIYKDRINSVLARNPSYNFFASFDILKCKVQDKIFSHVPLTTVAVERSFSLYKHIFSDKRRSLTPSNLEKLLIIYYNKNK